MTSTAIKAIDIFQFIQIILFQISQPIMPLPKQLPTSHQSADSPAPNHEHVLIFKSYLRYLKQLLLKPAPSKQQNLTIFDLKKTSSTVSLQHFLQRVFSYFKCGIQAYVCALTFIDRFLASQETKNLHIVVSSKNVFKILSVALLIATKNFDDFYYTNSYYARVCGLTLQQLNLLEKQFLKIIDFDVFVDSQQYQLYQTRLNSYKTKISHEMALAQRKENLIDEENRSITGKKNNFVLRQTCDELQVENENNVEIQVSA